MYDPESERVCQSYSAAEFNRVYFERADGTRARAKDLDLDAQSLCRSLWQWLGLSPDAYDRSRIVARREGDLIVLRAAPLHFLDDPDYWTQGNGNIPMCAHCFPNDLQSIKPCTPNCLFTVRGDGPPPIIEHVFRGVEPPSGAPYFVVAYGPPASGKSSILDVLGRLLPSEFAELDSEHTVQVNVDRMFQDGPLAPVFMKARDFASSRSLLHSQRLYRYYRWVADQIADIVLDEALLQKYNVLWESTGEFVAWTQREIARIRSVGYQVMVVFPLVGEKEIMRRMHGRKDQEATLDEEMPGKIMKASKNLLTLMSEPDCPVWVKTRLKQPQAVCGPHRLIMYDNEKPPGQQTILFDSANPHTADLQRLKELVPDRSLMAYLEQEAKYHHYA